MDHQRVEDRIAEVRHELVLRMSCGGPDLLEQEEELIDELAVLEQYSLRKSHLENEKHLRKARRWN